MRRAVKSAVAVVVELDVELKVEPNVAFEVAAGGRPLIDP